MNCTYCNSNLANARDHVIPRSWSNNESFAEKYVVPSCTECNALLSNSVVHSIEERAAYLQTLYLKRYRKLLKTPEWSNQELKEMSPSMRKSIKENAAFKKLIEAKIINLQALGKDFLS